MVELSENLTRALGALPDAPGGLLSWSLALAFASVLLAVLGTASILRPNTLGRRLHGRASLTQVTTPPGLRLPGPAQIGRAAWRDDGLWRLAWAGGLPLALGLVVQVSGASLSSIQWLYSAGALAAVGALVPGRWRAWRAARRRDALRLGFPDALDMMVVCVEAGLGLDTAMNRVAAEIGPAHPPIASELMQIVRELRAGKGRDAALRDFARRTDLPEIMSFASLLIQSEALGSGVARTLRVQAEEMRAARLLRAEERAHTLPVKLTIPLVVCVLPAMIAVVLLPGMIALVRDVLPNLGR